MSEQLELFDERTEGEQILDDGPPRISSIILNEDTGELEVVIPDYDPKAYLTNASLIIVAFAEKLSGDPDWVQNLLDEYQEKHLKGISDVVFS